MKNYIGGRGKSQDGWATGDCTHEGVRIQAIEVQRCDVEFL
jgi:hypothetical protein